MSFRSLIAFATGIALLGVASLANAQGVLIITNHDIRLPRPIPLPRPVPTPHPQVSYQLKSLNVQARIRDQIADVQVDQTFENTGSTNLEAQFVFPLPDASAIDEMTLMVNGKEIPAKLMDADEARQQYESIVRRNRDPALLEWMGSGMFQTSVFPVPPGEQRTVSLHYQQLVRQDGNLRDFLIPLRNAKYTSQPVEKISIRIAIEGARNLKSVYSPTHPVDIERSDEQRAVVTLNREHEVPTEDFRLLFDTVPGEVGATLLTYRPDPDKDGYFLLLASPQLNAKHEPSTRKTISFVVDKSGSMSGEKIEQAREAAKFVLNNLHEHDLFNIISYDSQVAAFRPELENLDDQTRREGLGFVDGLYAGGGTNIEAALQKALGELQDDKTPSYILFLTDGKPTSGETNESRIAEAARQANRVGARLMVFGVGYDVNSRLLDRLSRENHGLSEYVRPDEDIEASVARVYQRINSPVLTDAKLEFDVEDASHSVTNRVYPGGTLDLFEGQQLVVVGRYRGSGPARIRLTGTLNGEERTFEFHGDLKKKSADHGHRFVERLWAVRRIGEIIDEIDLNGKNEELVEELVRLSTEHGILTPYTAFLADETATPELASAENRERATRNLDALNESSGLGGFQQRSAKQFYLQADRAAPSSTPALGGAVPAQSLSSRGGRAAAAGAVEEAEVTQSEIRHAGTATLYKRGKLLVTPETAGINLEQDKKDVQRIERFSPEYFKLVDENTQSENELLSEQREDETLLVQLRGVNYLIE